MLFNKWTFSLLSLVMLVGLVCVVPSAFADGDAKKTHFDLDVTIGAAESMMDVSAKDGLQINSGRDRANRQLDLDGDGTVGAISDADPPVVTGPNDVIQLSVKFSHPVNLELPGASLEDVEQATADRGEGEDKPTTKDSGGNFGADDIFIAAFDTEGRHLGVLPLTGPGAGIESEFIDAATPGRNFLVTIHQGLLLNAYGTFEISKLVFFIPKGVGADPGDTADAVVGRGIRKADLAHAISHFGPEAHQHINKASNRFEVDLVDADEGDPQYAKLTGTSTAMDVTNAGATPPVGVGIPGVVSVMRTASRLGFIETGDFEVRITLTEEPMGGLTADKIMVTNGSVKGVVKGLTYKGGHPALDTTNSGTGTAVLKRDSQLGPRMVRYYHVAGDATAAGTAVADAATADNGTVANFPEATGRDNMYHSYIATITPNVGFNGDVMVSVGMFDDNVLPVPNRYIPITAEQRNATRLTDAAMFVRDARVMNESISVQVSTAGDAKVAAATAAFEVRSKDPTGIFNQNPNLKALGKGLVIPANGYLVLAAGKTDSSPISGVVNVDAKIAKKLTAAQKLYNVVYDFKLPFPANDLSNFFRNGGSLSLVYADIPAATGSGHGDSKASQDGDTTHADYTGYVGATSTAIPAGSVIINEIMWGLDANSVNAQYIELHNTTAADIGIDHLEWAIAVGSAPAPFTALDTISNNPAPVAPATSGYWQVPGSDGVSEIQTSAGFFTLVDIVSMSRVMGGTDGTMAASWAASMRPSANLGGRRIGTPGAANVYVKAPAPTPPAPAPTAPVATGKDIMITEIMVSSDGGRLPQWIELANVSAAAVSLAGWSVEVDNDPADTDVVGEAVSIDIGDVTVGKDQVVLIISKASTRNSGVGMGTGMIRADRIVDVQSQVSPTDARYSLISEMAFKITLLPPQTGGVVDRGDVGGNLGMGWELPMYEGGRSSIIRREMGATAAIMGTDAAGWVLASSTMLDGAYRTTYYGDDEDMGTPGYDAGGALPVELSSFSAARDKATGQVVITWSTQSELNNAGFFIKRSQQRNGNFVVVNPTMVPGAGTTSEKQSYTYTDTTAQPNIVYYYQIEDVSLDGNRQTLTRGHRLKGHIGAAGKATTTWGDLKSSRE